MSSKLSLPIKKIFCTFMENNVSNCIRRTCKFTNYNKLQSEEGQKLQQKFRHNNSSCKKWLLEATFH